VYGTISFCKGQTVGVGDSRTNYRERLSEFYNRLLTLAGKVSCILPGQFGL
jgi:hypothetical protein